MATVLSGRFCTIQASAADKALSASISQNKGLRGWNTRNSFIGACYPKSVADGTASSEVGGMQVHLLVRDAVADDGEGVGAAGAISPPATQRPLHRDVGAEFA